MTLFYFIQVVANNNQNLFTTTASSYSCVQDFSLHLDSLFSSRLPRILLADRHWMAELLIESLWWHLSSHEPDTTILKKQHPWGTPLFLGVALLKIGSHGNQDTKIDSMLDSLQCEWSPSLAKFLLQALK